VLIAVGGLLLTVAASRVTGPTFDEERRLTAVRRATELIRGVVDFGPTALASSSAEAIYDELAPFGTLPSLFSGWFGEVLATARVLDRLTAARLGWLLLTGLAPAAAYFLTLRSHGPRVAALSACVLLCMPRWMHAAAAAREPAIVASIWLTLLALYVQSVPPPLDARLRGKRPPFRLASVAFAIAFGLGLSITFATLWVLPLIGLHAVLVRSRGLRRVLRQGMLPLPAGLLLMIVVSPVTLLAATPVLWKGGGAHAAQWLLSPLAPSIEPLLYRGGPVVSPRDVPGGYALRWLVATTPALVLVLALAGAYVLSSEFWARRHRAERRQPRFGLGLLLLLGLVAVVLGPAITPAVLTLFPPRIEAALPLLAIAAAVAVERAARRVLGPSRSVLFVIGAATAFVAFGLFGLPTASASFGLLAGGTARAIQGRAWTVGDGSELAVLARSIDAVGMPRLTIDAPEVPRGFWSALENVGRLRTHVDPGRPGPLALSVVRGPAPGAISTVVRDGATLWSLSRR
jgi:hypothetical protein